MRFVQKTAHAKRKGRVLIYGPSRRETTINPEVDNSLKVALWRDFICGTRNPKVHYNRDEGRSIENRTECILDAAQCRVMVHRPRTDRSKACLRDGTASRPHAFPCNRQQAFARPARAKRRR